MKATTQHWHYDLDLCSDKQDRLVMVSHIQGRPNISVHLVDCRTGLIMSLPFKLFQLEISSARESTSRAIRLQ